MESVGRLPAMGGGECEEPDAAVAPVPSSAKKKNKTTWLPPSKRHAGWSSCASAAPAQQRNTSRHHYDNDDDDDDALPFGRAPFCLVVGHARLASLPRPHTLPRTTTSSTSIIIITQQQQASCMPEAKVYVGNLDPDATDRDIDKEFARYGKIAHIWIARKPPGK